MSFFEYMMHRAAPVLFWMAILLFFGGLASSLLLERDVVHESILDADSFIRGIVTGLSAASWPFAGAGIIWTLQRLRGEGEK